MNNIFTDFHEKIGIDNDILQKYSNLIPNELTQIWKEYGLGSILQGYLKIINPEDFVEILNDSYFRSDVAVPIFATGMGDIITWEENRYLRLVEYRKGIFKGLSAGFEFFFSDLENNTFLNRYLDAKQYFEAIDIYGEPAYDECFGYTPLLGLGGSEKTENLKKVKIREHIQIITEFMGPIQ
ncbi:T6SS immunity protein Tdi1 domain-containing protein [Sporolactobacillus sp. KGMB 08714]|uniref:T6SS immunity protein Tdi1 domain-containing protein n=1 Tax=Sporolactobacillus sp. KGMB 08714 TaxID=3064704 RepID=UPI002FBDCBE3